jgi:SAM-dependent methyltransferase
MTSRDRWLAALWPLVRTRLPSPPARVLDVGCGPLGGFVPFLRTSGYDAVGVDPEAPRGARYHRIEFERLELPRRFDAAIASTSLHHVNNPREVIDRLMSILTSGGALVVVEWAWERFDQGTATWCFERLAQDHETWLHRRRDEWATSGQEWQLHLGEWASREGLHRGHDLLRLLDDRFERRLLAHQIRATRIDWVGAVR